MKLIKIMLPVIALLAVGTGCANKNDVNNNADNNIKVVEQHNNEELLDIICVQVRYVRKNK